MADSKQPKNRPSEVREPPKPGPARLFVLLAGVGLALLGVLGFFYDSSFGTGDKLTSDDLAGILNVNGWRNLVYLVSGALALALGPRFPRATAFVLGAFYLALGLWGLGETERDIGSLLDALPLGNDDNALHLIVGGTGLLAALADGGLPAIPKRSAKAKKAKKPKRVKPEKTGKRDETAGPEAAAKARGGGEGRRRPRAGLRGAGDDEPR